MNPPKKLTPLMEQYWTVKAQHPDKIILFRMGDFFEMFNDDAVTAAPVIGITLTSRNKKKLDETPMCGMPHHSVAGPIAKLLSAGHKIAICDQVEDPKKAIGLVKRAVTRVLSPGMVFDPNTLDALTANYICSYDSRSISFLDVSTGEAFYYKIETQSDLLRWIQTFQPVELVLTSTQKNQNFSEQGELRSYHQSVFEAFEFKKSESTPTESSGRLLTYATQMKNEFSARGIQNFELRSLESCMQVSPLVLRHLEIFKTYGGEDKGSLFHAIRRTKTPFGARTLKQWIKFPLLDLELLELRLSKVERLSIEVDLLKEIRGQLSKMGDVERRLNQFLSLSGGPRDLMILAGFLESGLRLSKLWDKNTSEPLRPLLERVQATLNEELPDRNKWVGVIKKGYLKQLDDLIALSDDGESLLQDLEQRERNSTGIASLKIRFNNVFGYYIEVTKSHLGKVPKQYIRKQTLANAERYTTPELQSLETKVLSAGEKRADLEQALFNELRVEVANWALDILSSVRSWAEIDVYASMAWLALELDYVRPEFSPSAQLDIEGSRHPVVEQLLSKEFVRNKISMKKEQCILLTGPNMAGKSTLMRQVALTALLGQVGSFVPASKAILPIFDRIFTRIGASDFLAEGLSTFMVEMKETAEMLRSATSKSLILLDEVGRGTSTYDGMSLAQAILEYIVKNKKCKTLFATHYHELTQLERRFESVQNYHMTIIEKSDEILFLYTLKQGAANKSYGVQVARLAGMPNVVTQRATGLLNRLEEFQPSEGRQLSFIDMDQALEPLPSQGEGLISQSDQTAMNEKIKNYQKWQKELGELTLDELTPMDVFQKVNSWQKNYLPTKSKTSS